MFNDASAGEMLHAIWATMRANDSPTTQASPVFWEEFAFQPFKLASRFVLSLQKS